MGLNTPLAVLPRLHLKTFTTTVPLPATREELFTHTFGQMLPPATYLNLPLGRAAYHHINSRLQSKSTRKVLLLHGIQTPALGLLPLVRELQSNIDAEVALFDLWGHGFSDTPWIPHTSALFSALINAVLRDLGWILLREVDIVGFSFGASLLASYIAIKESPKSAVFIAPAGFMKLTSFGGYAPRFLGSECHDDEGAAAGLLNALEGPAGLAVPRDWRSRFTEGEIVAPKIKEWQTENQPGHMASVLSMLCDVVAMGNAKDFLEVSRKNIPRLVVLGGEDDVCSQSGLYDTGFEEIVVIPSVGHSIVEHVLKQ